MPIYEYRCTDCGFQEEYLRKVSEPPLTVCPSCGQATFRKLVSAAGFQLKGSGWYQTDFRGSGKPVAAKTESQGESKPETPSAAKSDAKPEKGEAKAAPAKSPAAANSDS